MKKEPIIIVGMARSGTTLVSHLLGRLDQVHLEVEPHMLWKAGNFHYLADNEFEVRPDLVTWVRNSLLSAAGNKVLVEKSPVNCIRPQLVYAVFPEARIVYVERDMVRCIHSNLKRSLTKDSFKLSIVLRKYFLYSGSHDLDGAIGKRKLFQQLRKIDFFAFGRYVFRMAWLRNVRNLLPFGPKLKGFQEIVRRDGLLAYHVNVAVESMRCREIYQQLYGKNFEKFSLEKLQRESSEIKRLYDYCGFSVSDGFIENIMNSFDNDRVTNSSVVSHYDQEIKNILSEMISVD